MATARHVPTRMTYRIRQIPPRFQLHHIPTLLRDILPYHGDLDHIEVHSLASDIASKERPPTKVATVTFRERPTSLCEGTQWVLKRESTHLSHNIIVDNHFLGFTTLNDVGPNEHTTNCIAISGLASHPFGSWMARDRESNFMWLRDKLPRTYPDMHSIIYGYDTKLIASESFQDVQDIAISFTVKLRSVGLSSPSAKPIVFIAHSLGGVVLKQALVDMANGAQAETSILSKVKEIVLFGVPNRGMTISHLDPMVHGQANECLVEQLCEGSPYVENLENQFQGISFVRKMRLISVYETQKTKIPQRRVESGEWKREGPSQILVKRESAIHRNSSPEDVYPIDRDHSNLVKFMEDDIDLGVVLHFLSPDDLLRSETFIRPNDTCRSPEGPRYQDEARPQEQRTSYDMNADYEREFEEHAGYRDLVTQMLQSLFVEQTTHRFETVHEAFENTYDWVFHENGVGFVEWLNNDKSLFWVSGKPGSGKSTLMKNMCLRRHQYRNASQEGNEEVANINAEFFFSHRGSYMQKSFEGLLHCLLHKIISEGVEARQRTGRMREILFNSPILISELEQQLHTDTIEASNLDAELRTLEDRMSDHNQPISRGTLEDLRGKCRKTRKKYKKKCKNIKGRENMLASMRADFDGAVAMSQNEGKDFNSTICAFESARICHIVARSWCARPLDRRQMWDATQLEDSFTRIIEQRVVPISITLFLDALDEYDGDPDRIASFLTRAVQTPPHSRTKVKICFASRPWNIFQDRFAHQPGFRMQDHTGRDIEIYVRAQMARHIRAVHMLHSLNHDVRRGAENLVHQLLLKADGVFLWVRLVLGKLLEELTDGATVQELSAVLDDLPEDLEKLYSATLSRIEPRYREEAYIMLEIVLRAEEVLSIAEFWDAVQCVLSGTERLGVYHCCEPSWQETTGIDRDTVLRRIKSRCGGFLEIRFNGTTYTVQLMHQTVKEFLLRPAIRRLLLNPENPLARLNGYSFLAHYCFNIMHQFQFLVPGLERSSPLTSKMVVKIAQQSMYYARSAEVSTGISQAPLLDALDSRLQPFLRGPYPTSRPLDGDTTSLTSIGSSLVFGVVADLRLYVHEKIQSLNQDTHDWPFPDRLISQALIAMVSAYVFERSEYTKMDLSDMIQLLLEHSTQIQPDKAGTVGQILLQDLFMTSIPGVINSIEWAQSHVKVAKVLLNLEGVDVNADLRVSAHRGWYSDGGDDDGEEDEDGDGAIWLDSHFFKPLHLANSPEMVKLLIAKGADVNSVDSDGITPLERFLAVREVQMKFGQSYYRAWEMCVELLRRATAAADTTQLEDDDPP